MQEKTTSQNAEEPDSGEMQRLGIFLLRCRHFGWMELRSMLTEATDMKLVADYDDLSGALDSVAQCQPDVVVASATLPDTKAVDVTQHLRAASPGSKIILVGDTVNRDATEALWEAGSSAYLPWQDITAERVRLTIQCVAQADLCVTTRNVVGSTCASFNDHIRLRINERDCLILHDLGAGLTERQIAEQIGIGHRTVAGAVSRLERKLDVPNRCALVLKARELDLI